MVHIFKAADGAADRLKAFRKAEKSASARAAEAERQAHYSGMTLCIFSQSMQLLMSLEQRAETLRHCAQLWVPARKACAGAGHSCIILAVIAHFTFALSNLPASVASVTSYIRLLMAEDYACLKRVLCPKQELKDEVAAIEAATAAAARRRTRGDEFFTSGLPSVPA